MKKSTKSFGAVALALGAGTLLALTPALAASAHVTASATSTAAGSYTVVTFSVPHGCEASPTTQVTIELPESIPSVTPTVNPNWTVEKNVETLAEPLEDAHGNEITERVASVVYTAIGDGLADGYRDAFELSLKLPEGEAGDVVEFPTYQVCAEGSTDWVGDEVPAITLTAAATGDDHAHGDETAEGETEHAEAASSNEDVLARVFGIGGLVIGAVGVVIAVLSRRSAKA
ncbi:YcnI family protein [Pseudolysinimonas sp.]|jgi:uncharacterized protein YcnI|uniref:YcnI family protein n=1 Tax=Pseudolysinimonas sp. TaxID=2680009 RepID=UPI003784CCEB